MWYLEIDESEKWVHRAEEEAVGKKVMDVSTVSKEVGQLMRSIQANSSIYYLLRGMNGLPGFHLDREWGTAKKAHPSSFLYAVATNGS